jgi:hypothetical protein
MQISPWRRPLDPRALLGPLLPRNYRSVAAADVAKSLLMRVPVGRGREIVLSGDMH